MVETLIELRI